VTAAGIHRTPRRRGAIFVDSSAFYSLADRSDTQHARATAIAGQLRGSVLMTTDLVLAESWYLVRARLGRPAAVRLWETLCAGAARVECVLAEDLAHAWAIGQAFADQDSSLTDCTSFAFMERTGIRCAFSFDRDFGSYRYGAGRRRSFEVLGL
jgi:predicted nucleic acid-binding protein